MVSGADELLQRLCAMAETTAAGRGHHLGDWGPHDAGRRAACRRCGAVAYVRVEQGMSGVIGAALTDACPGAPGDGHTGG